MVKAYGEDLRIRVVKRTKDGKENHQQAADIFDIGKSQKFIEKNPDKTLKEIGEKFKITDKAVWYITKQLGITYKKTIPV